MATTYTGVLNPNFTGKPISGVLCVIYDVDGIRIDAETTDKNGSYTFAGLTTGPHQIRFFGRGYNESDYIDVSIVDETTAQEAQPLTYLATSQPSFSVTETEAGYVNAGESQQAVATLTFNNMNPHSGNVRSLVVLYKQSRSSVFDNTAVFNWDEGLPNISTNGEVGTFELSVPMYDNAQSKYDFKVSLLGDNGDAGRLTNAIVPLSLTANNVIFNGVADVAEYVEVTKAVYLNNELSDTNSILNDDQVELEWQDLRTLSEDDWNSTYPSNLVTANAYGQSVTITWDQAQLLTNYGVFMFMSTDGSGPDYEHPVTVSGVTPESNGSWVFLGDTATNNFSRALPFLGEGPRVAFWIGARWGTTISDAATDSSLSAL